MKFKVTWTGWLKIRTGSWGVYIFIKIGSELFLACCDQGCWHSHCLETGVEVKVRGMLVKYSLKFHSEYKLLEVTGPACPAQDFNFHGPLGSVSFCFISGGLHFWGLQESDMSHPYCMPWRCPQIATQALAPYP